MFGGHMKLVYWGPGVSLIKYEAPRVYHLYMQLPSVCEEAQESTG